MTVTVANNYNQRKPTTSIQPKKKIKIKQQLRTKLHEEEDDENVNDISSSKLNIAANIPIAPMSPQLSNVHSSSNHENRSSNPMKKSVQTSPLSAHRLQRMSLTTTTASISYYPNHTGNNNTNLNSARAKDRQLILMLLVDITIYVFFSLIMAVTLMYE